MIDSNWQPTTTIKTIKARAHLLKQIRTFFYERNILEVETPLLSQATITDPHILSLQTTVNTQTKHPKTYYLQTSPEFAMKRLLAFGIGSIFQICKAFRDDESGRYHNPEFTMLEWYRPGFDHHQLMDEVDDFLQIILQSPVAERVSYQQVFEKYLNINPHQTCIKELQNCAKRHELEVTGLPDKQDDWLNLLLTHCIEPQIGNYAPIFIYDFPASQAALARLRSENNTKVAERFEVYYQGMELANGFHELVDAKEQLQRFEIEVEKRKQLNLPITPIDHRLIQALQVGFPACAGIAVGIDRLLMIATNTNCLSEVINFSIEIA